MFDNYTQDEIRIAQDIAQKLDDYKSIRFHLKNARKYKEAFLREQLEAILTKPQHTIETCRAAYYNFLVNSKHTQDDFRP